MEILNTLSDPKDELVLLFLVQSFLVLSFLVQLFLILINGHFKICKFVP